MFCLTKVMLRRFSHCVFIHLNQLLAYHVWSHRVMMLPMQDKHKAGFWTRIMDDFAKGVACDSTFWLSMFTSRKWHERGEPREFRSFRIQTNKTFLKQKFNKFLCQKKNEIFVKEISLSMLFFWNREHSTEIFLKGSWRGTGVALPLWAQQTRRWEPRNRRVGVLWNIF